METYYQVEAVEYNGERLVLVDSERPLFYSVSVISKTLQFETEQEAFAAAGRYCTDFPNSCYNPLVFRYTTPEPEVVREQVR